MGGLIGWISNENKGILRILFPGLVAVAWITTPLIPFFLPHG